MFKSTCGWARTSFICLYKATTLGVTGGDLLAQTLNLGYAAASVPILAIFVSGLLSSICGTGL